MVYDREIFIENKIHEMEEITENNSYDLYRTIALIGDVFSSPYIRTPIVSIDAVRRLWSVMSQAFFCFDEYEKRFEIVSVMNDIFLYAKEQNVDLNVDGLSAWRKKHLNDPLAQEIVEYIDNILTL